MTSSDGKLPCKTESYTYLGSIFTSDGKIATVIKRHSKDQKKQLTKLTMFLDKHREMPFPVKLKVLNACFLSSILYGCESWLNTSLTPVGKLYKIVRIMRFKRAIF